MSHSLCRSLFHIVFSTKERRNLIPRVSLDATWAYMAGIARNHQLSVIAAGGTQNHVHLFLELPPDVTLSDAVRVVKCNSSRWLRQSVRLFAWQEGYAAFSVSPSNAGGVLRYVEHQAEHHARYSFDDELRAMMRAAGIEPHAAVAPEGAEDS